jgi:hypothetical protein
MQYINVGKTLKLNHCNDICERLAELVNASILYLHVNDELILRGLPFPPNEILAYWQ